MSDNDSAITPLIEGYERFRKKNFEEKSLSENLFHEGQNPKVLIVACCDSRVDPAILTECDPGDIFVVRNIANLIPPFESDLHHHGTSAALEYGVKVLKISDIIILGHSHCGGIRSLFEAPDDKDPSSFIDTWMDIAKPAKEHVVEQYPNDSIEEQARHCEKESLLLSLKNLKTFPWIAERVAAKTLSIHAWYFDLETGDIEAYDEMGQPCDLR